MDGKATVAEVITLLRGVRERKESCTIYITSDLARSAIIMIKDGVIIDLRAGPFKGLRAIERIRNCKAFTYRLEDLSMMEGNVTHEESDAIFAEFDKVMQEVAGEEAKEEPVAEPEAVEETPKVVLSDEAIIDAVSESLMSFMGPASRFICEDIAKQVAPIDSEQKLQQLITLLAAEIGDGSDAVKFSQLAQGATESFFR